MPFSNNKKPSRKPKILPQFYVTSGGKPLLDLLEIQRQSFFALLENGIVQELSKTETFQETAKTSAFTRELELVLKPETYKLISPICTPKQAILNGSTYACKLYVQATLTLRSKPVSVSGSKDNSLVDSSLSSNLTSVPTSNSGANASLLVNPARSKEDKVDTAKRSDKLALRAGLTPFVNGVDTAADSKEFAGNVNECAPTVQDKEALRGANSKDKADFVWERSSTSVDIAGEASNYKSTAPAREYQQKFTVAKSSINSVNPGQSVNSSNSPEGSVEKSIDYVNTSLASPAGRNADAFNVNSVDKLADSKNKETSKNIDLSMTKSLDKSLDKSWEKPEQSHRIESSDFATLYMEDDPTFFQNTGPSAPPLYTEFITPLSKGQNTSESHLHEISTPLIEINRNIDVNGCAPKVQDTAVDKMTKQSLNWNIQKYSPWIFLGELPLMTKRGNFILNGSPRVIINQITRCPGIYFQEKRRGVGFEQEVRVSADFIPQRGPWLRIQSDWEGRFWARLKREGRVKYTTLYEAFQEFEQQYTAPLTNLVDNSSTSLPKSEIVAFQERKAKEDRQKKALLRLFKNSTRYNLGKLGRLRINERVHNIPQSTNIRKSSDHHVVENSPEFLEQSCTGVKGIDHSINTSLNSIDFINNACEASPMVHGLRKSTQLSQSDYSKTNSLKASATDVFAISPSLRGSITDELLMKSIEINRKAADNTRGAAQLPDDLSNDFSACVNESAIDINVCAPTAPLATHWVQDKSALRACFVNGVDTAANSKDIARMGKSLMKSIETIEKKNSAIIFSDCRATKKVKELSPFLTEHVHSMSTLSTPLISSVVATLEKTKKNKIVNFTDRFLAYTNKSCLMAADINAVHTCLERLLGGGGLTDDIDHLKNRLVRTSGELLQQQLEMGLNRLNEVMTPLLRNLIQGQLLSSPLSHASGNVLERSSTSVDRKQLTKMPVNSLYETLSPLSKEKTNSRKGFLGASTESTNSVDSQNKVLNSPLSNFINPIGSSAAAIDVNSRAPSAQLGIIDELLVKPIEINRDAELQQSAKLIAKRVQDKPALRVTASKARNDLSLTPQLVSGLQPRISQSSGGPIDTPFRWLRTSKSINGAFREFFGSNPLSQYMDQTNPLAEITHKRRLSSMGPGGIKRETAGMEVRGIHPTHYGRVCPIETPEGKNAGLVNSPTVYGRIGIGGFMETPLYKVTQSQVQKERWTFFTAQQEENEENSLATGDTGLSPFNFLPHIPIPVQTANNPLANFQQVKRNRVGYKALSPVQTISIATALIPFLEHDDANRALMGSNMQRQAIPLLLPERPIVGTGFESMVMVESGQGVQATKMGCVSYVSAKKIVLHGLKSISPSFARGHQYSYNFNVRSRSLVDAISKNRVTTNGKLLSLSESVALHPLTASVSSVLMFPVKAKTNPLTPSMTSQPIQLVLLDESPLVNRSIDFAWSKNKNRENFSQNITDKSIDHVNELRSSAAAIDVFAIDVSSCAPSWSGLQPHSKELACGASNDLSMSLRGESLDKSMSFFAGASNSVNCKIVDTEGNRVRAGVTYKGGGAGNRSNDGTQDRVYQVRSWIGSMERDQTICDFRVNDEINNAKLIFVNDCAPSLSTLSTDVVATSVATQTSIAKTQHANSCTFSAQSLTQQDINCAPTKKTINSQVDKRLLDKTLLEKKTNLQLCLTSNAFFLRPIEHTLQIYQRSNQETCLSQRPLVKEGDWVQKGDLMADCAASDSGDLALGKNVIVAYMPWEGYNFEDAIVISDRLVADDVYTSVHIERYEIKVSKNSQGKERITNQIPSLPSRHLRHLDKYGIAQASSWMQPGDILVGKVVELKRPLSPYERLAWELASRLSPHSPEREKWLSKVWLEDISLRLPLGVCGRVVNSQIVSTEWSEKEQKAYPLEVHVYLAIKRKIQVGDKLAGRHGNKGIVSIVLPRQDMPYLADGSSVDMVLNPLGVPSRMNVGQIFECLLGLAGSHLGCNFKVTPFDEIAGGEASRSLVFLKLYQCRLIYKQEWLFTPTFPGKSKLFDGRTGEPFENWVTVGRAYMLKLIHMVDHKIHARSTGPYSLFTRQPVRGRARRGGQRLGEMEVWAVEGFGAAYTLQEFLTIKSDDLQARTALQRGFYKNNDVTLGKIHISPGNPEAFKVLVSELQALCLHIQM